MKAFSYRDLSGIFLAGGIGRPLRTVRDVQADYSHPFAIGVERGFHHFDKTK